MRLLYFYILIFLAFGHAYGQTKMANDFQRQIDYFQQNDSLAAFTYTCLDEFLKHKDFSILEEMRRKQWRMPESAPEALALVILLSNEGYYRLRYSQIAMAVGAYEEAWRHFQRYDFQDFDIIEYCLKPLGNAYSMLGDYTSAENIIKSYLLRARQQDNSEQVVAALINLSIVYHDTGQYERAVDVLHRAIGEPAFSDKAGLVHSNLAKSYLQLGQLWQAKASALRALKLFKKKESDNTSHLLNTYSTLSLVSLEEKDTLKALGFLEQAAGLPSGAKGVSIRESAKVSIQISGIQTALGNYEAALAGYRTTLLGLIPKWNKKGLPDDTLLYAENTLKELFDGMAAVYLNADSLDEALQCYKKSFEVEELLKATYSYRESKYLLQNENRERTERVIGLYYMLFQKYGDSRYLQQAFIIAERTKSIALKDELNSRSTWSKLANDSLWLKKNELIRQKALVENALIQEQLKGATADITVIQGFIEAKNKLTLDSKELERFVSSDFDRFEKQLQQLSLPALETKLEKDGVTLVEYFFGTESLYVFVLNGSTVELYRDADIEGLRQLVKDYSSFFVDEAKINAAPKAFAQVSWKLYSRLFPIQPNTPMFIIPDGLLNFLPFEPLLTEVPVSGDYGMWPWLLTKAPILYQYSGTSYLRTEQFGSFSSNKILGIFPHFEDTDRYLKYSEEEVDHISEYLKGDFFQQQQATKQAFVDHAANYPVIHLSTHAKAGGIYEPPSIAFIDSALYLPEIYGMNLQTELLVLGACETGIGKLYRGEGPLSLASGFFHAGVKNIVLSLWKVNDFSTSKLMANFYSHYAQLPQPHLALYQAKVDYLLDDKISIDKKSPYYWASFVYYGGTQAHRQREPAYYYYCLEAATILLLAGLIFWYRVIK
ncbi:hypothetical protein C900_05431 [Fulvivirga imtechensis AK7]|uniref:CHAT domain-containing protein n=1 Tax=Fulvivirga imtechensis AK7 TaxID=1237149 RepID=L8JJR7_9BACT|nr:CHAT domain-containing protein [Fulvivirga imtechensis]ELR69151.1 hypothetical protein C900_05431 [Fulvivirga imtechensis AK7]